MRDNCNTSKTLSNSPWPSVMAIYGTNQIFLAVVAAAAVFSQRPSASSPRHDGLRSHCPAAEEAGGAQYQIDVSRWRKDDLGWGGHPRDLVSPFLICNHTFWSLVVVHAPVGTGCRPRRGRRDPSPLRNSAPPGTYIPIADVTPGCLEPSTSTIGTYGSIEGEAAYFKRPSRGADATASAKTSVGRFAPKS